MVFANPEARSLLANRHRRSPCVLLLDTLDDPEQGINRQLAESDRLLQAFEALFR
jgi:hypothetical protein